MDFRTCALRQVRRNGRLAQSATLAVCVFAWAMAIDTIKYERADAILYPPRDPPLHIRGVYRAITRLCRAVGYVQQQLLTCISDNMALLANNEDTVNAKSARMDHSRRPSKWMPSLRYPQ
eukprot:6096271-Pyramimonas_sp.AAC.1